MNSDLVNLLHERAAEQYGPLWYEVNRILVDTAQDARLAVNSPAVKECLSIGAYRLCQLQKPMAPNLHTALLQLNHLRDLTITYFHEGMADEARYHGKLAAHHAIVVLGESNA